MSEIVEFSTYGLQILAESLRRFAAQQQIKQHRETERDLVAARLEVAFGSPANAEGIAFLFAENETMGKQPKASSML